MATTRSYCSARPLKKKQSNYSDAPAIALLFLRQRYERLPHWWNTVTRTTTMVLVARHPWFCLGDEVAIMQAAGNQSLVYLRGCLSGGVGNEFLVLGATAWELGGQDEN